jgi:RNA polymerase sigma-70 factor (ECF subfamily)
MTLDNLAAQHRPMLLCYARALVGGDEHHAEDVVQESFLIAHRRRDDFREGEDFGRWLRGIARNKVLEGQRSSARQPIVDSRIVEGMDEVFALFDAGPTPDEPWRERLARLLKQCVDKLTPTLRDALMQVYRDGRSLRDAAAALASSPPAVAQRLSRARELIRECVQSRREAEA